MAMDDTKSELSSDSKRKEELYRRLPNSYVKQALSLYYQLKGVNDLLRTAPTDLSNLAKYADWLNTGAGGISGKIYYATVEEGQMVYRPMENVAIRSLTWKDVEGNANYQEGFMQYGIGEKEYTADRNALIKAVVDTAKQYADLTRVQNDYKVKLPQIEQQFKIVKREIKDKGGWSPTQQSKVNLFRQAIDIVSKEPKDALTAAIKEHGGKSSKFYCLVKDLPAFIDANNPANDWLYGTGWKDYAWAEWNAYLSLLLPYQEAVKKAEEFERVLRDGYTQDGAGTVITAPLPISGDTLLSGRGESPSIDNVHKQGKRTVPLRKDGIPYKAVSILR